MYKSDASEPTLRGLKGLKSRLSKAIDYGAMSIEYGREAADHYRRRYGLLDYIYDGAHGFIDRFKRSSVNKNV